MGFDWVGVNEQEKKASSKLLWEMAYLEFKKESEIKLISNKLTNENGKKKTHTHKIPFKTKWGNYATQVPKRNPQKRQN